MQTNRIQHNHTLPSPHTDTLTDTHTFSHTFTHAPTHTRTHAHGVYLRSRPARVQARAPAAAGPSSCRPSYPASRRPYSHRAEGWTPGTEDGAAGPPPTTHPQNMYNRKTLTVRAGHYLQHTRKTCTIEKP